MAPLHVFLLPLLLPSVVLGRCCMPKKMSGLMDTGHVHNQYIKHVFDEAKFQIDFDEKKVLIYDIDKMPKVDYLMVDFENHLQLVRHDDGSCTSSKFGHLRGFENCVPKNAYDENKILGIRDPSEEYWSFSLEWGFTSVHGLKLKFGSCIPTSFTMRWDTYDWPYDYRFSNVSTSVPSDSGIYKDNTDCVMDAD